MQFDWSLFVYSCRSNSLESSHKQPPSSTRLESIFLFPLCWKILGPTHTQSTTTVTDLCDRRCSSLTTRGARMVTQGGGLTESDKNTHMKGNVLGQPLRGFFKSNVLLQILHSRFSSDPHFLFCFNSRIAQKVVRSTPFSDKSSLRENIYYTVGILPTRLGSCQWGSKCTWTAPTWRRCRVSKGKEISSMEQVCVRFITMKGEEKKRRCLLGRGGEKCFFSNQRFRNAKGRLAVVAFNYDHVDVEWLIG